MSSLPDDLYHEVRLSVVGETAPGGEPVEETLLDVTTRAYELPGQPIGLFNSPDDGPLAFGALEVYAVDLNEDKLAMAIGRGGQNVRLASELTGWELNVMTEKEAEERSEAENQKLLAEFKEKLDVDEEVAGILVAEGFSTIEEVAYVPEAELNSIEEFDADMVNELRNRARDYLLTQAIMQEEVLEAH